MSEGQRKLAAIMFTDIVGYSALSQKSEALALELLEEHRRLLRPIFPRYEGKEVEAIGDAFFVIFPSSVQAVRCAVEMQRALLDHNSSVPKEREIWIRIGLHVRDVMDLGDRVHGDAVNITSRIEPLAEAGGICLSEDTARQIRGKVELPIRKLGKGELRNIALPVDIYRVVLPWEQTGLPLSWCARYAHRIEGAASTNASIAAASVGIPFEEKMTELSATLYKQFAEADQLEATIKRTLGVLGYGG